MKLYQDRKTDKRFQFVVNIKSRLRHHESPLQRVQPNVLTIMADRIVAFRQKDNEKCSVNCLLYLTVNMCLTI